MQAEAAESPATRHFLTFRSGDRTYAVPAEDVTEVIRVPPMARVPQGPVPLLGLFNLRGSVLPATGLRELLGSATDLARAGSRGIVLNLGAPVTLIVDAVDALVTIPRERIEADPAELATDAGERLLGAFKVGVNGPVARILDIATLLDAAFAQRARTEPKGRRLKAADPAVPAVRDDTSAEMLVTFEIAGQEFALGLDAVQEIVAAPATSTAVPRSEALVLGMTSLRDALLPLLSLRGLLGFPPPPPAGMREKVVVVRVAGTQVGLVADQARAVIAADAALLDPVPPVLSARAGGETRIRAIYRGDSGRRLISILAPEQLFREDVMQRLRANNGKQMSQAQPSQVEGVRELKVLVFRLGADEFGLPIDAVDEVAQVPVQITKLPKTPKFLEGVVNLRGDVLPVIDQRRRFDMPPSDAPERRRLVVVRTERHRAGLVVDAVSDVLRVPADAVNPPPALTEEVGRLVHGVINLEISSRMVLLLDPAELLTRSERGLLDAFRAQTGHQEA